MMRKINLSNIVLLLVLCIPLSVNAIQAIVDFETCFDLEAGSVAEDDFLFGCSSDGDITFEFNGNRTTPTVLFWNESNADMALLTGVPYAAVNQNIITDGILFADHINDTNYPRNLDVPFNASDTAIIRTGDGNYYKVGYAICEVSLESATTYTGCIPIDSSYTTKVRFRYKLIQAASSE